jgi:hypothetical protein
VADLVRRDASSGSQNALHEYQIEPPVKFASHFAQVRHSLEPQTLMQLDGDGIAGVDPSNEHVLFQRDSSGNQCLQQLAA